MKTSAQTLKSFTLSLTLFLAANVVSFEAQAFLTHKMLKKSQLMQLLSDRGLPEGTQQGVSTEGDACELVINIHAGEETVSMKSAADETVQQFVFQEDVSDIHFQVREAANKISIKQDFFDSYQEVKITKTSSRELSMTFIEYIAGDTRTLTCTFK